MTKESNIVTAICVALQYYENQGKLYFLRNNSGAQVRMYQNKDGQIKRGFIRSGKKGSSDIIVLFPHNCVFVEVKTEAGKLSPDQKTFAETIGRLGFEYHVVRSVDEVKILIDKYVR